MAKANFRILEKTQFPGQTAGDSPRQITGGAGQLAFQIQPVASSSSQHLSGSVALSLAKKGNSCLGVVQTQSFPEDIVKFSDSLVAQHSLVDFNKAATQPHSSQRTL